MKQQWLSKICLLALLQPFISLTAGRVLAGSTCAPAVIQPADSSAPNATLPSDVNNGTSMDLEQNANDTTATKNSSSLNRRSIKKDQWEAAVSKGKDLWDLLLNTLNDKTAVDASVCGITDRWDINVDFDRLGSLNRRWEEIYDFKEDVADMISNSFYYGYNHAPKDGLYLGFKNFCYYSPDNGVIEAASTFMTKTLESGEVLRAPDRWSDITWATWQGICEATRRTSPAALTRILQRDIRNDQTQDIMDYAITLLWGDEASENDRYNELKPGSDEFFALLQTPNVVGAVYMLIRFVNGVGRKSIRSIRIVREYDDPGEGYFIWIELEKFESA